SQEQPTALAEAARPPQASRRRFASHKLRTGMASDKEGVIRMQNSRSYSGESEAATDGGLTRQLKHEVLVLCCCNLGPSIRASPKKRARFHRKSIRERDPTSPPGFPC